MSESSDELIRLAKKGSSCSFKRRLGHRHELRTHQDRHGNFLVHHAVNGGNTGVVEYLLESGVSATTPGENGATPLHYAAARGNTELLRLLLQFDNAAMPLNQNAMTPLHVAAGEGHPDVVRLLIGRGAQLNATARLGRLAVHFATGTDQLEVVKFLVSLDPAQLLVPDDFGMQPLHWACYFGAFDTAQWLLSEGVPVNESDVYGRLPGTFAQNATCSRLKDAARGLPGWPLKLQYSAIHEVVLAGDQDQLQRVLADTENTRQCDAFGRTPLHLAALTGNRGIFEALREWGLPTSQRDDYGWTPWKLLSFRRIGM